LTFDPSDKEPVRPDGYSRFRTAATRNRLASRVGRSLELDGDDDYVTAAYAHLTYRKAIDASSYSVAQTLRDEAEAILGELIKRRGEYDARVHHIRLSQSLGWINRWCRDDQKRRSRELKDLLEEAGAAAAQHGKNQELRQLRDDIKATLFRSSTA
jgi:hypothetical protein